MIYTCDILLTASKRTIKKLITILNYQVKIELKKKN